MGVCPDVLYKTLVQDLNEARAQCEGNETYTRAIASLEASFLKKFKRNSKITRNVALTEFVQRATTCNLISAKPLYAIGFLRRILKYLDPEEVANGARYSNGSSVDMPHGSTSGVAKHALGRITASSLEAYKEYMGLLRDFNKPLFDLALKREMTFGYRVDVPSSVTTVPKTNQIDRVIAVEPTCNAYLQQGVKSVLENRLRTVGIDLRNQQENNRYLARRGSLNQGLATIDLSAASDSISVRLLKLLLPEDWFDYIVLCSNTKMRIKELKLVLDTDNIPLTMGNAITFPLQTLIFLAICYEVYSRNGIAFRVNENVAVFGDDIIVLDKMFSEVILLLTQLGFSPNKNKCFGDGDGFRESCGADWFNGVNIRGVYLKQLNTLGDHFTIRNLLSAWSYRWSIALHRTLAIVDDYLTSRDRLLLVPISCSGANGVRTFVSDRPYDSTRCWYTFKAYHTHYRKRKLKNSWLDNRMAWGPEKRVPLSFRLRAQAALAGWISNGYLNERPKSKRYSRVKTSYASIWGVEGVNPAERWLYDTTCTTSGLVPDWDN